MSKFKTPSKIQVEPIECGAVATWIILGYYNKWLSTEEARTAVNVTKDGSTPCGGCRQVMFEYAGDIAINIAEQAIKDSWPASLLLNLNLPPCEKSKIKELSWT